MFTIRFIKHGGRGYKSYSCQDYDVNSAVAGSEPEANRVEVKMTLPDGSEQFEQIGPTEPYDIAYVTNEAGRTIDKITM